MAIKFRQGNKPKNWHSRHQAAYQIVRSELDEVLEEDPELKPNSYVISKAMEIAAIYRANYRFEYSKEYLAHIFGLEPRKQSKAIEDPDYIYNWNHRRRWWKKLKSLPY